MCDPRALAVLPWPVPASAKWARMRAAVTTGCSSAMAALSAETLRLLAPGLHDQREKDVIMRGDPSVLDVLWYDRPAAPELASGMDAAAAATATMVDHEAHGMGPHVDPGLLSCKYVPANSSNDSSVGRLEVLDRKSGRYVSEEQFAGSVLCFVNQNLADWTVANQDAGDLNRRANSTGRSSNSLGSRLLTATMHRVVMSQINSIPSKITETSLALSSGVGISAEVQGIKSEWSSRQRISAVYEMRAPARDLWTSVGTWAAAQRQAKRREAKRSRHVQKVQRGSSDGKYEKCDEP